MYPDPIKRPTISIAYLQLMVELMAERGINSHALLRDIPIDPALLRQPDARMSAWQWSLVILRAQALSREPGLGYEYGLRMRPTVHGVLGYAAMSSASLRQALELSMRYARVRQAGFRLEFVETAEFGELRVFETAPVPVLRSFFLENILLGLARSNAVLLGQDITGLHGLEICFDWPQPDWHADWRARLPPVYFNQPVNLVRVPASMLSQRPVLADPLASQQAIDLCERELGLAADNEAHVTSQVRSLLLPRADHGYPKLDQVAEQLRLSPRTLKRRLQQQGTSFLLLLEEARQRDAIALLLHTDLSVAQIATRLGYQNPANFSRAFSKWTGEAPLHYRRRLRQ